MKNNSLIMVRDEIKWSQQWNTGRGTVLKLVMGSCEYAVVDTHRPDGICHAPISLIDLADPKVPSYDE